MSKRVEYHVLITLHDHLINDNARKMLPEILREFSALMVTKYALVTGAGGVEMRAWEERFGDPPTGYISKPFDLTTPEGK